MDNPILSVSELNREARRLLERQFPLLWVAGEISNLTSAASGHLYFTLKDSQAQVRCVMFRSRAQLMPWQPENGQQVEALALVTLYETRGDFQLNVETLRRAGLGRLYEMFIKLRDKLAAEGLFDAQRKRPIPRYPRRVGIITSPQAAALSDVIAAFARRAPHVELLVYPTLVQGSEAPRALIMALQTAFTRRECDVLLIVRGGGSIEDLWAFNDESVARMLASAPMPTICGIGHETDTTIVDYVADLRAPTPTAAAELATAGWHEAASKLSTLAITLKRTMRAKLEARMQALDRLALRLIHPGKRLTADRKRLELLAHRLQAAFRQCHADGRDRLAKLMARLARARPDIQRAQLRLTRLDERLRSALRARLQSSQQRLLKLQGALSALSPLATLTRGYSIVQTLDGHIVRTVSQITVGETLLLRFARGTATAHVTATVPDADL